MTEECNIEKKDFKIHNLEKVYSRCIFTECEFSDLHITDIIFDKCKFVGCNFSLTKFNCVISDSKFRECKMTGADFSEISKLSGNLQFEKSILDYSIFIETKLRNTLFIECNIKEAYFDKADITASTFDKCDLERTTFGGTNLEKVDFRTAYNYSIIPENCRLKKTVFSEFGLKGLVEHLNIIIKD